MKGSRVLPRVGMAKRLAHGRLDAQSRLHLISSQMRTRAYRSGGLPPLIFVSVHAASAFGREVFWGISEYANEHGRWRFIPQFDPHDYEPQAFPACDGLLLGPRSREILERAAMQECPFVNLSDRFDVPGISSVTADSVSIGRMAAEHLLALGHVRFVMLGDNRGEAGNGLRLKGFRDRLAQSGHDVMALDSEALQGGAAWEELRRLLAAIPRPFGAFAYNDRAGWLLCQCCREANLNIPEEVAVIAVDNDSLWCEACHPPLSSIDPGFRRIGYLAAQRLDKMMQGVRLAPEVVRIPPERVVPRASSDVVAIQEKPIARAVQYLREHACRPCTVTEAARHAKVGRRWLELRMSALLGCSPHEYMMRVRLDRACRLLVESRLGIPDIAERSGFGYETNLRRAFSARMGGETPAQYRHRLSGKQGIDASRRNDIPPLTTRGAG